MGQWPWGQCYDIINFMPHTWNYSCQGYELLFPCVHASACVQQANSVWKRCWLVLKPSHLPFPGVQTAFIDLILLSRNCILSHRTSSSTEANNSLWLSYFVIFLQLNSKVLTDLSRDFWWEQKEIVQADSLPVTFHATLPVVFAQGFECNLYLTGNY